MRRPTTSSPNQMLMTVSVSGCRVTNHPESLQLNMTTAALAHGRAGCLRSGRVWVGEAHLCWAICAMRLRSQVSGQEGGNRMTWDGLAHRAAGSGAWSLPGGLSSRLPGPQSLSKPPPPASPASVCIELPGIPFQSRSLH